ncbi:MAG: Maf family nucleotide pyrophosphatase [Pseudomonadota bacterium]|nr:Maf family nucleotide pyrophosphatase [Pseudomonadota bacterium]
MLNDPLILASTSVYRRELLTRLRLPFTCERPETDETPLPGEAPVALAERLAQAKAAAVALQHPHCWVLGSDQVAELDGRPIGKPGDAASARAQLRAMSGSAVAFRTGVCLIGGAGLQWQAMDTTTVRFRHLSDAEIERYVVAENPCDCAGSFKAEGLGISLFELVQSQDPTALIGLPLIATARLLREAGFTVP